MDITVVDDPPEGRYEALSPGGKLLGMAEYSRAGDVVTMSHVEVAAASRARGSPRA